MPQPILNKPFETAGQGTFQGVAKIFDSLIGSNGALVLIAVLLFLVLMAWLGSKLGRRR